LARRIRFSPRCAALCANGESVRMCPERSCGGALGLRQFQETHRPITFAMRGATYGLKALSQPSGMLSTVADCKGDTGARDSERMGLCAARLATVVVRSSGETWYNMLPLLSRRVTVDTREFAVSIVKAGTTVPRTLEATPIRSALCIRSTVADGSGGRVSCATPPSRKLTPAHAHDATAHSPAVTVK
jgi:hypothetical protein